MESLSQNRARHSILIDMEVGEQNMQKDSPILRYPVFVKLTHPSASFGMRKVENERELFAAIDVAFQYDSKLIIEEA